MACTRTSKSARKDYLLDGVSFQSEEHEPAVVALGLSGTGGGGGSFNGGGGGSSYIDGLTNASTTAGMNNGNGSVTISW